MWTVARKTEAERRAAALAHAAQWLAKQKMKARSGGPKTNEGKKISSQNSRKHGVTSKKVETHIDAGLDIPEWLFVLGDQLREMADESDPMGAVLIRKALIAAWRTSFAQDALDLELARSAYLGTELGKSYESWASDAIHGVAGRGSEVNVATTKKLARYAARFRSEQDNAIRLLRLRPLG
jgi:hypothetical protein